MESTTAQASATQQPQLKSNAITFVSNVVIGVASTAPGFSLATTVGFIVAIGGVGLQAPAVMLVSFVPMFCIAIAYQWLNKADPDCGTTFSWVTRAMGPQIGWLSGWGLLVACLVVMATQSSIAGSYSLQLFDIAPEGSVLGIDATTFWITVVGVFWILVMTVICYIGIELSARTQQGLLAAEIVTLLAFAVVALIKVYGSSAPEGSLHIAASWFNPFAVESPAAMLDGLLLGVFLYWGWDSAVSVNEETVDGSNAPGKAAVLSTILLLLIYIVVTAAAQAYAGEQALVDNAVDIFAGGLGNNVLGDGFDKLLIIAVLTSSAAATQTTILPAARAALSMGRKKAIPSFFSEIHHKHQTPGHATWVFGVASVLLFIGLNLSSENVLADSLTACGFLVCFYYAFTGFACILFYRKRIFRSTGNFMRLGLLPLIGAVSLSVVFIKAFIEYSNPENTNEAIFGLGVPLVIGIGALIVGLIGMLYANIAHREFFRENRPETVSEELAAAEGIA
ncbi:MAG: APC family permease [Actinomycetes bacterium]